MTEADAGVQDAIVIGGGPAGLFAAWRLAVGGAGVTLLETGGDMRASLCGKVTARMQGRNVRPAEKFRLQCQRCDCLTGLGGAAFHFDTNLGYVQGLSRTKVEHDGKGGFRTYSGLERALGDFDRAARAVADAYEVMYRFGLPPARAEGHDPKEPGGRPGRAGFVLADEAFSQAITVDDALTVVDNLLADALAHGLRLRLGARAERVRRRADGTWQVSAGGADLLARNVVVAVGKLGLRFVRSVLDDNAVAYRPSSRVDLGVRLEAPREIVAPLTASCHNPKLTYLNEQGEPVRTFCVCEGGRMMQYAFLDTVVLDGQHCLTTPTQRTNFGIVTTIDVPAGGDGSEYALDFARRVNAAGAGGPVVQPLLELLGRGRVPQPPGSSLVQAIQGDLAASLGPQRVADIAGMVDRMEDLTPGLVGPATVVAAPVVERLFPAVELSDDLQSSAAGLYFAGDCSSKIIGVTYGAATGVVTAESILR
ncbi:FAD-dependent oxidoreductase [Dactylosporangium sp. NPDC050688]|uniref:FAD-dependent oxidoreductase n=1 Tax=Dactylosporangium sp. NPDC050688 TaxID=3157217 RepID=UPI0033DE4AC3